MVTIYNARYLIIGEGSKNVPPQMPLTKGWFYGSPEGRQKGNQISIFSLEKEALKCAYLCIPEFH